MIFLTLDHINNDGAEHRREIHGRQTAAGYQTYRWLMRNGFPPGFQVLCANCNHGKRMNGGTCPHQVRSNDYPMTGVEPNGSKRGEPLVGYEIVSSVAKVTAATRLLRDLREVLKKHKALELHEELEAEFELVTQLED